MQRIWSCRSSVSRSFATIVKRTEIPFFNAICYHKTEPIENSSNYWWFFYCTSIKLVCCSIISKVQTVIADDILIYGIGTLSNSTLPQNNVEEYIYLMNFKPFYEKKEFCIRNHVLLLLNKMILPKGRIIIFWNFSEVCCLNHLSLLHSSQKQLVQKSIRQSTTNSCFIKSNA